VVNLSLEHTKRKKLFVIYMYVFIFYILNPGTMRSTENNVNEFCSIAFYVITYDIRVYLIDVFLYSPEFWSVLPPLRTSSHLSNLQITSSACPSASPANAFLHLSNLAGCRNTFLLLRFCASSYATDYRVELYRVQSCRWVGISSQRRSVHPRADLQSRDWSAERQRRRPAEEQRERLSSLSAQFDVSYEQSW